MEIQITDLIKTSKPGASPSILFLPFFKDKPGLCIASVILEYVQITSELRGKNKRLFLTTVRPYGPASTQTIGHWIKSLLQKAGININDFSAYSTRHATVSAAFRKGVDINIMRKTAGWSPNSTMFTRFYNRPVQTSKDTFDNAILRFK